MKLDIVVDDVHLKFLSERLRDNRITIDERNDADYAACCELDKMGLLEYVMPSGFAPTPFWTYKLSPLGRLAISQYQRIGAA